MCTKIIVKVYDVIKLIYCKEIVKYSSILEYKP